MEKTDNLSMVESDIHQELSLDRQAASDRGFSANGSIEELIESEHISEEQPDKMTSNAEIMDGSGHPGELRHPSTI